MQLPTHRPRLTTSLVSLWGLSFLTFAIVSSPLIHIAHGRFNLVAVAANAVGGALNGYATVLATQDWWWRRKGRIDRRIERLVRHGIFSARRGKKEYFEAALDAFPDQTSRNRGMALLIAICLHLEANDYDLHQPTDDPYPIARKITEHGKWLPVHVDVVADFMRWVHDQSAPLDKVAMMPTAFVVAANLLDGADRPEGMHWNDYLSRVEEEIEAEALLSRAVAST